MKIAVVIPCFNEAKAIGLTLREAKNSLPNASLYVFDNNSTDGTSSVALAHGAQVRSVQLQGKGNVVRRMFADVEADVYVMIDGDATYDLSNLSSQIEHLRDQRLDMIVGRRKDPGNDMYTYRPGHRWGNQMLTGVVATIFGQGFSDMLSGYRIFSRRYVKSFSAAARGFEIETELTVHALEQRMPYAELDVFYRPRPEGSHSKLSTYKDGWRILKTIFKLLVSERPLEFFMILALILVLLSLLIALPVLLIFVQTGLVPRLPTAVLATGVMLCAMLSSVCGAILHTVTMGRREAKRFAYLSVSAHSWD
jgi:glycosyltransferase involved in cell wall biosynthesis